MIKVGRVFLRAKGEQKKRRWWHYLDLILIILVLNVVTFATQPMSLLQTAVSTASRVAQYVPLASSYTGLNTIAIPLEKIVAQIQQNPADCSDPNISQEELEKCLTGDGSSGSYTKDNPKIQNPIAKKSALFFYTPTDITINNGNIRTLWTFMLGIVDAFLVLILMLNGAKILLTGGVFSYSRAIEEFPSVLLAIIVAHISLTFMMAFIGLNNNMTNYIYTFAQDNPNIHRSKSGFGAGDTTDYIVRIFFPTMDAGRKDEFENETDATWQDARDHWSTPDGTAADGKRSATKEDVSKLNDDMTCTLVKINFDNPERIKLFGAAHDPETSNLYTNIKGRSEYILKQSDNLPDDVKKKLQDMPGTMLTDLQQFDQDHHKWYTDFIQFTTEMTQYENNTNYQFHGDATSYKSDSDSLISATSELFHGAGQANPTNPGRGQAGDVVIFNCENDATGSAFQLVPDDLDFENLFKNLSEMGKGLKMVIKLLALMMLGQMIIRLFFINLYIITAPLGIACWALPGRVGQPVARLWLQGFITTVIVQFVMVIATIITQVLLGNVLAFVGGDPNHIIGNLKDGTLADLVHIACLWFVIRIPSLLGSAPMNTMAEAGQLMGQAVGTTVAMQITQFQMVTQAALSGGQLVASVAR